MLYEVITLECHAGLTVETGDGLLLGHAVFDDGDVAQLDRSTVALGHDDLPELGDALRLALGRVV